MRLSGSACVKHDAGTLIQPFVVPHCCCENRFPLFAQCSERYPAPMRNRDFRLSTQKDYATRLYNPCRQHELASDGFDQKAVSRQAKNARSPAKAGEASYIALQHIQGDGRGGRPWDCRGDDRTPAHVPAGGGQAGCAARSIFTLSGNAYGCGLLAGPCLSIGQGNRKTKATLPAPPSPYSDPCHSTDQFHGYLELFSAAGR